jgi:CheY-like chemotaxis protein
MYGEYLRLANYEIDETADGREALAKALSRRHDVIVTETWLTGIDGYHLCALLRRDPATAQTPIVVVTGDAYEADLARAREAGATAVLVKPCLPETLLAELRRLENRTTVPRRDRTAELQDTGTDTIRPDASIQQPHDTARKKPGLSRAHRRGDTSTPPVHPPALVCPSCDATLIYRRSHVGGVSARHQEQWDYFECPVGCGTFQYRQRTRKLRKV